MDSSNAQKERLTRSVIYLSLPILPLGGHLCFCFESFAYDQWDIIYIWFQLQKKCPNNLRFNTMKQECDWPTSVQCGSRPITSTATGAGNECQCFAGITKCYKTDIRSCNQFYVCVNGTQYMHKCPSGKNVFQLGNRVIFWSFILIEFSTLYFQDWDGR